MILEKLDELAAQLTAIGLPATTDPQKLNAPAALVRAERIRPLTLTDGYELHAEIVLIAPDHGIKTVPILDGMLLKALQLIEPDGDIQTDASIQTTRQLLPAYQVPIVLDLHIPQPTKEAH